MSHFSILPTRITDAETLRLSLMDLGLTVKTHAAVRGDRCQQIDAEVVAVLPGDYDLGWTRNAEGSFDLVGDLWGVARKHNPTDLINRINSRYALHKAMEQVRLSGHTTVSQQTTDVGTVRVVISR